MKNAELLVCTSEREAFPMALVEAFACNTKAVSADCAFGPSEILVGDFASYLVKSDQNSAYIEKINLALRTYPKKKNPILQECAASNIVKNYLDFSAKDFFTNK